MFRRDSNMCEIRVLPANLRPKTMKFVPLCLVALLVGLAATTAPAASEIAIIPQPEKVEPGNGTFTLRESTRIVSEDSLASAGEFLAARLEHSTGWKLRTSRHAETAPAERNRIVLTTEGAPAGAESYTLDVSPDSVTIRAGTAAGAFYGVQSLLQLFPPQVLSATRVANISWEAPAVHIEDKPRFAWRGLMLDVSRHFCPKPDVERLLDLMALHKLNVFHWHLVDDQGWRIEIKKYPKLTQVGAWRDNVGFGFDHSSTTNYGPNGRYGGFYTQNDIREVVAYAAARHITIVPEIEMPGHSGAALAAYPQFSCSGKLREVPSSGGVRYNVYCAGNDATFGFIQDVLTEVMGLFPGKYIHIGGDEVTKTYWEHCPLCQERIKTEGLHNEEELQSYFIRRIEKFINSKGRTLIGWSEIQEGGLAKNAALMDWIGGAVEGATAGHDVVMSPNASCYLDHYQSLNRAAEPRAIGGFLSLSNLYAYEPIPKKLAPEYQHHILGAQGNLWTEYIPNNMEIDYMIWPRECAISEFTWSQPASRNWEDFQRRLTVDLRRLGEYHVNYCRDDTIGDVRPPTPRDPVPSERQVQWERLGVTGFLHFGVNTFTDREWGNGDESEKVFNPTNFDADQIAREAAEGGLKGLILTCKHHDGFCLWPSAYTTHSVKNSPWKNGHGDVVREVANACRRHGLLFGVYLSPWDRNRADYGTPEYVKVYREQLSELLTNYGPIFEVWFDGANGGDGYYGGAREKRTIDRATYYDWPDTWKLVHKLQPNACIFSDAGPDIRWVGNESGHAGETCWATLNRKDFAPGQADADRLNTGDREGTDWVPAECDVSIRPGWFYHSSEDSKVKTPAQLVDLYFDSVGRGASLLLNVPPNRNGQMSREDEESLEGFHRIIDGIFTHNLAAGARTEASNVRGNDYGFAASRALDGWDDTYWSTDDGVQDASLVVTLPRRTTFNIVSLREYLPLGQRIDSFALDQWQNGQWIEFAKGTSIGKCRLVRGTPVTTDKVRVRLHATPSPALAEFGLYSESR